MNGAAKEEKIGFYFNRTTSPQDQALRNVILPLMNSREITWTGMIWKKGEQVRNRGLADRFFHIQTNSQAATTTGRHARALINNP